MNQEYSWKTAIFRTVWVSKADFVFKGTHFMNSKVNM